MRTLKVAVLALSLAVFAVGCGKKKDPAAPAPDTSSDTSGDPCGGGEGDPCGDPCGADPCGGDE
ncbi:MAG: hypothetical protein HS111_09470 [Kofleriaceae bacterium]|nr:hypothetical protein [Kofleriaceae bacterium]MCL4224910.1 hypothetical protein [Myxococcales bacterium]